MDDMILSASGWRGVFAADGDEESKTDQITARHKVFAGTAARIFAEYLGGSPVVLLGTDTRPTGKAIIEAMIPVLLSLGCDVRYAGIVAAPEIMAWARCFNKNKSCGFIYVSASHNPIGHNGLKFGLTDGGVLAAEEANKLITSFRAFMEEDKNKNLSVSSATSAHKIGCDSSLREVFDTIEHKKAECLKAYYDFCGEVVWGEKKNNEHSITSVLQNSLKKQPLGIVCDFNGSARTVSIDKEFFSAAGFKFESINDKPGQIVHRIVPEGESLEPCVKFLEDVRKRDTSFMLGYVPDCDGDRGNLVIWDDIINKARALEAQEVFALACVAELAHLVWTGDISYNSEGKIPGKAAVAINDPTSMRIDRIAENFGVSIFRAEVGEANVVNLARNLRKEGYLVRILGEGSAGGNITHPSAVRDPINTVLAIAKMLTIKSINGKSGLFEIWCKCSGQMTKYRSDFTLADIIASLPSFITTAAYNENAIMRIKTTDHAVLKERYQEVFLQEWEEKKDELNTRFGFCRWEAIAYNGTEEKRNIKRFGDAGKGGLKVLFFGKDGKEKAYIWMRGSATEPVFRIMADVEAAEWQRVKSTSLHVPTEGRPFDGDNAVAERYLLDWQRCMIIKADTGE
ncbi:MAG: phosphatidylglycerol lysyltransferase [Treponema sp.]|nr:phosphatidylglycerol lysyltransferase [Treponema sp.]